MLIMYGSGSKAILLLTQHLLHTIQYLTKWKHTQMKINLITKLILISIK
nr:MAG TPA: hypothetical protein [Caudoviricetes sp.]